MLDIRRKLSSVGSMSTDMLSVGADDGVPGARFRGYIAYCRILSFSVMLLRRFGEEAGSSAIGMKDSLLFGFINGKRRWLY